MEVVRSTFEQMLKEGKTLRNNLVVGVGMGRTALEIDHLLVQYKL